MNPFMTKGAFKRAASRLRAASSLALAGSLIFGMMLPVVADTKGKVAGRALTEEQKIVHLLNRIGYGPRPGDVERVKRIGIEKFIEQQLYPDRIDDSATEARLAGLDSLRMTVAQIYDKYPAPQVVARSLGLRRAGQQGEQAKPGESAGQPGAQEGAQEDSPEARAEQRERRQKIFAYYAERGLKPPQRLLQELQAQKIIRAIYSERQLQEVMTDFWFNHFNVFWGKGADKWLTTDFEMSAIRPHTMGKFEDLLLATAKSPAMLFFLDNFQSSSPDAQMPGRRGMGRAGRLRKNKRLAGSPNLNDQQRSAQMANQLRNRKRGINENYARELMELHTLGVDGGYTQKDVQEVARAFTGWSINQPRQDGRFVFRDWMHDDGEKVVLGQKIAAGGGMEDGKKVIGILAHHPNTARFISAKLVRRFVSDTPPQSLVERVAGVYQKTGGDIREMLRAIFTSREFYSPEAYRAKIKSPFELVASAVRALGGDTNGQGQVAQFIAKMGQPLYMYQPPTGYPDRAEQWVNTGALLERLNFGLALSTNRVRGTVIDLKRIAPGADMADTSRVMEVAITALLNGEVSPETRGVLNKQLREGVSVKGELGEVSQASMGQGDSAEDINAVISYDFMRDKTAGKARLQGKRLRMRRIGDEAGAQMGGPNVDPETAKVFGLVLGSPEFQRR